jgi:hypothetical protein
VVLCIFISYKGISLKVNALFFCSYIYFFQCSKSKRKIVFLPSFFVEHISGEKINAFLCEREKKALKKRFFVENVAIA